ncbi:MAG: tetratricopeptide repeat protein [Azonexus sp.]|nr:tetratricopeptide repeat protein [Azonexus sp.]
MTPSPRGHEAVDLHETCLRAYREGRYQDILAQVDALLPAQKTADLLNMAGLSARKLGRMAAAEACYRAALVVDGQHAPTRNNLAILLQANGANDEAQSLYEALLAQTPDDPLPALNLGNLHLAGGRAEAARAAYAQALRTQPRWPPALRGLAEAQFALADKAAAMTSMRSALRNTQEDFDMLLRLAEWRRSDSADDPDALKDALSYVDKARQWQPKHARAACMQGELLQAMKRFDAADAAFRSVLDHDPDNADVLNSYGILLNEAKRYEASEAAYRRALALRPDFAEAHNNLAVLLQKLKRFGEALPHYQRALEHQPDYAAARCNLGLWHLAQGMFGEGWTLYEARYAPDRTVAFPRLKRPQWQGESLVGKGILIWNEQGLGDEIQFARYAVQLKSLGARHVGLICRQPLSALFRTLPGVDRLHEEGEKFSLQPYDYWVFPQSIPRWLCPTPADIPAVHAYLRADSERMAAWQGRLGPGVKVGLVWRGRAEYTNDANRSVPDLRLLAPLWQVPGLSFHSLQKGEGEQEAAAPPSGQPMIDLGSAFRDFSDTAAVVAQMDVVICVDTAIAHLCGALGVPCWVMLPYVGTDWRWQLGRSDSPWYPSLRLFRQPAPDAWGAVVRALQAALIAQWGPEQPDAPLAAPDDAEVNRLWHGLQQLPVPARLAIEAQLEAQTSGLTQQAVTLDWARQALAHQTAGRIDQAAQAYAQALARAPGLGPLWHNYGALLRSAGRDAEALSAYERALNLQGPYAEAYYNRGNIHEGREDYPAAIADYREAIRLRPAYAEAWYNLGVALKAGGDAPGAIAAYRRAIALRAGYSEAHNNLGMLIHEQGGDPALAEAAYREALQGKPRYAEAHNNLGVVLQERQQFAAAELEFREALGIRPDYHDARWNLALMLMVMGRFAEAWPWFEARRAITRCQTFPPPVPFPEWQGEPLAGRWIVVWPEQGFGDEIQFSRYFSLLKSRGAGQVLVACKPPLRRLFASLPAVDACIEVETGMVHLPPCDCWVLSMSLPRLFATTLETVPGKLPYLAVDRPLQATWAARLPPRQPGRRRVGVLWQGSPAHPNDRRRSLMSADLLSPLAALASIDWVDLHREAVAQPSGIALRPLGRQIEDFADSAALVSQLDLVITVDTAMAHLAGSLAKPVWVLLPHAGLDWRWLCEREDSPWYPGVMRLFRQSEAGWPAVIARLVSALRDWLDDPARLVEDTSAPAISPESP